MSACAAGVNFALWVMAVSFSFDAFCDKSCGFHLYFVIERMVKNNVWMFDYSLAMEISDNALPFRRNGVTRIERHGSVK